jgi:hypothetical protein
MTVTKAKPGRWVAKLSAVGAAAGLAIGLFSAPASAANNVYYATYSSLSGCRSAGAKLVSWHYAVTWECDHETSTYYSLWYLPA